MSRLFQIYEDDLAELERTVPQLADALIEELANPLVAPRLRVQLRRCRDILSNVRWNYGPPENVQRIEPGDQANAV